MRVRAGRTDYGWWAWIERGGWKRGVDDGSLWALIKFFAVPSRYYGYRYKPKQRS